MSGDEEQKPMYITDDLLEQVLRNQIAQMDHDMGLRTFDRGACIAETEALLERLHD